MQFTLKKRILLQNINDMQELKTLRFFSKIYRKYPISIWEHWPINGQTLII